MIMRRALAVLFAAALPLSLLACSSEKAATPTPGTSNAGQGACAGAGQGAVEQGGQNPTESDAQDPGCVDTGGEKGGGAQNAPAPGSSSS
jgi:Spy/CpxP family protein refolding chaperone